MSTVEILLSLGRNINLYIILIYTIYPLFLSISYYQLSDELKTKKLSYYLLFNTLYQWFRIITNFFENYYDFSILFFLGLTHCLENISEFYVIYRFIYGIEEYNGYLANEAFGAIFIHCVANITIFFINCYLVYDRLIERNRIRYIYIS